MSKQETKKQVITYSVVAHGVKAEPQAKPVETDWLSMAIVSAVLNALLLGVLLITRWLTL